MTPGEIDKMGAGPEIDALVAEKRMGWVWHEWIDIFHVDDGEWVDNVRYGPVRRGQMVLASGDFGPQGPPGKFRSAPPRYSTDISAAWKAVEHWHSVNNRFLNIAWNATSLKRDGYWSCALWEGWDTPRFIGEAPTAPLAICRAALKVVMT